MDDEQLLLAKTADLESLMQGPAIKEYDALRAAAIIRHLLTDQLLAQVSRRAGLPLKFQVAEPPPISLPAHLIPAVHVERAQLWPDAAPQHWERRDLNLAQFLALKLVSVRGEEFSIRDFIAAAANRLGGVHHGDSNKGRNLDALVQLSTALEINGLPVPLINIIDVGLVTLRSAQSLRGQLMARSE